jgi:hypothetical protein
MSGIKAMAEAIKKKTTLSSYRPLVSENTDKVLTFKLQNVEASNNGTITLKSNEASTFKSENANNSGLCNEKEVKTLKLQNANAPHIDVFTLKSSEESNENIIGVKNSNSKNQKLIKTTIYLTEEANQMLNIMYAQNILSNKKGNKYDIFTEAIELLYNQKNVK